MTMNQVRTLSRLGSTVGFSISHVRTPGEGGILCIYLVGVYLQYLP